MSPKDRKFEVPVPEKLEYQKIARGAIIVFPQERKTFDPDHISDLAASMGRQGMLTPLKIARFTEEGLARYISEINLFHKNRLARRLDLRDYLHMRQADGYFYVLIAGECRIRGCDEQDRIGCSICRKDYGDKDGPKDIPGGCFEKHFPGRLLPCDIFIEPDFLAAQEIQGQENVHEKPPPYEEADFVAALFEAYKRRFPDVNFSDFSGIVPRSTETISKMVAYSKLPSIVRKAVEGRHISYGYACELSRLKKQGFDLVTLQAELRYIIEQGSKLTVAAYGTRVRNMIESQRQLSLLELMNEAAEFSTKNARRKALRQIVGDSINDAIRLIKGISFLCNHQIIPLADSPLLDKGNLEKLQEVVQFLETCLGDVAGIVETLDLVGIPHLSKIKNTLGKIEKSNPDRLTGQATDLIEAIRSLATQFAASSSNP